MLRYDLMGLSLHPFRGGMMPHPIRGMLSLHPFRERTSCGSKLNALAQVACLWLRQAEPAPNSRIGFVRGPTACLAMLGLCKNFVSLVQAGSPSLHPFRGGIMPRPIRVRVLFLF